MRSSIFRGSFALMLGAIALSLAILSLNLLSADAVNRAVTASVRADIRKGDATFPSSWDRNLKTGFDSWTDCLVLEIATFGEKDFASAMTRANYVYDAGPVPTPHRCDALDRKLGGVTAPGRETVQDYWRYWWGSAALLNIVTGLLAISLPAYQAALKNMTYLSMTLVLAIALMRYRRDALPLLPVLFALAFGFGIPLFGQSIAHAPCLIAGLLLLCGYMALRIDGAAPHRQFPYLFAAGGIGLYFDLLNGDLLAIMLCFAVVRLIHVLAFALPAAERPEGRARFPATIAVAATMASYIAGAAGAVALRIVLRATLSGEGFAAAVSEWQDRLSIRTNSGWTESGLTLHKILRNLYIYADVATFPYLGTFGVTLFYAIGTAFYFALGGWLWLNRRKLPIARRDPLLAACLIACVVPAWYCIFPVHAIVHFWMIGRLLSLFFAWAAGIALIAVRPCGPQRSGGRGL